MHNGKVIPKSTKAPNNEQKLFQNLLESKEISLSIDYISPDSLLSIFPSEFLVKKCIFCLMKILFKVLCVIFLLATKFEWAKINERINVKIKFIIIKIISFSAKKNSVF
jgi:hypothetical protein